jgi:ATP-binding cassette, subfamily F, member 3
MLTVHHLSKSFGIEIILHDITFSLNRGERIGLVGPNGCGKTTLIRIIAGLEKPDQGSIQFDPPDLRLGYLAQGLTLPGQQQIGGYLASIRADLASLTNRLEQLAGALSKNPLQPNLQEEYDRLLYQIESLASEEGQTSIVMAALGLDGFPPDTPVGNLSGGQKTRLALAGILLANPQLLLLDEPTNHLDIEMLEWLEDWLRHSPECSSAGIMIVSHDRAFLDATASGILEIDPNLHTMRSYPGNYTFYLEAKINEQEHRWQEYSDQQSEIKRLHKAATQVRRQARFRVGGKGDSGDKFAKGFFGNRSAGTIRRAKMLEQRLERLLTEDKIDKPRAAWQMKLDFGETPLSGRDVVTIEELSIGYGDLTLLKGLNLHARHGDRIALIGPNGAGKTTLVRTIAGHLPPLAGQVQIGANVRIGYMAQEQENLDPKLDAFTTIRKLAPFSETDTRAFLHQYLFGGDDVFIPISKLSYGERARLSLACQVVQGCNLLLLDEPINHLDIPSRGRFEQSLTNFQGTVLAVVHDRFFIEGFANQIWEIGNSQITVRTLRLD